MRSIVLALLPLAIFSTSVAARVAAAPIIFTVDSAQSPVVASFSAGTIAAVGQTPGSLTTNFEGTLSVDLATPGMISFPGGGLLDLATQLGPFLPGNAPAQIAGKILIAGEPFLYGAGRDGTAQITGTSSLDTGGNFLPSSLVFNFLSGVIDYATSDGSSAGEIPISPTFPNRADASGSIVQVGNQLTLTVPFYLIGVGSADGLQFTNYFTGTIVANATIPEPGTLVLAVIGTVALFGASTFRHQRC